MQKNEKIICNNKKAYHNYFISQTYLAGIVLMGSEVKSIRLGGININDAFITITNGEVWLKNCVIKPYEKATNFAPQQNRNRKLLLNKIEIEKLKKQTIIKGNALVPIKVILKGGLVKVEIGLGKGKKLYDKKDTLKENDIKRAMNREIKSLV
jgi:SsrA-binding protein